jgi:hypothetical protein
MKTENLRVIFFFVFFILIPVYKATNFKIDFENSIVIYNIGSS